MLLAPMFETLLPIRCRDEAQLNPACIWRGGSVVPVEVMDRPVAVADREAVGGGDRGADKVLGVADGCFHVLAFGKPGCDG